MDLRRYGPQTVPDLASARFISRQIIQTQINELKKEGYVEGRSNPEHKRSKLIALTQEGEAFVDAMIAREHDYMDQVDWLPDPEQLHTCVAVLDAIYDKLEA